MVLDEGMKRTDFGARDVTYVHLTTEVQGYQETWNKRCTVEQTETVTGEIGSCRTTASSVAGAGRELRGAELRGMALKQNVQAADHKQACEFERVSVGMWVSYILGSDWVVLAAASQNTQPELDAYNFSTKGLQSCKGFLSNEEQCVGKLQNYVSAYFWPYKCFTDAMGVLGRVMPGLVARVDFDGSSLFLSSARSPSSLPKPIDDQPFSYHVPAVWDPHLERGYVSEPFLRKCGECKLTLFGGEILRHQLPTDFQPYLAMGIWRIMDDVSVLLSCTALAEGDREEQEASELFNKSLAWISRFIQDGIESTMTFQDSYDVATIMEIWWNGLHNWSAEMGGYKLFQKDRQGRRYSGLALYIRESLDCIELDYSDDKVLFFGISYVWDKFQELYGVALGSSGLEMLLLVIQTRPFRNYLRPEKKKEKGLKPALIETCSLMDSSLMIVDSESSKFNMLCKSRSQLFLSGLSFCGLFSAITSPVSSHDDLTLIQVTDKAIK
ncbi:hypothetical protein BTVI_24317 [Pitangus sulphuratus]|nr:hypothetical protein BTVI_24317 [Pitangus sulphuratus]